MHYSPILAPIVALVAWSLIMLVGRPSRGVSAFAKMGITWGTIPRGSRGSISMAAPRTRLNGHRTITII